MDLSTRMEALLQWAEQAGIEIRPEPMGGQGGGLCRLRGRRVLFVDTAADLATRYDITLTALANLPEIDQHYLTPTLREDLQRHRSALPAAPASTAAPALRLHAAEDPRDVEEPPDE